jgi:hypothetical protein
MLDMKTPGIDIRPLRELTGEAWFNEVFFNDVFVPDECLVGAEHDGWRAARTTLANERVYMGSGSSIGYGVQGVLALLDTAGLASDPIALDEAWRSGKIDKGDVLVFVAFGRSAGARWCVPIEPVNSRTPRVRKSASSLGGEGAVTDGDAAMWVPASCSTGA